MTKHQTRHQRQGRTRGRSRSSLRPAPPSSQRTISQFLLLLLMRILQKRPLTFWGLIAATPIVMAVLAIGMLLSPGYVADQAQSPRPTPTEPIPELPKPVPPPLPSPAAQPSAPAFFNPTFSGDEALSLVSLGVIAVSCAAGTLMVSRHLTQPKKVRRLLKTPDRPTPVLVTPPPSEAATAATRSDLPSSTEAPKRAYPPKSRPVQPQPTRARSASPLLSQSASAVASAAAHRPAVTVLPPDQTHPLDWNEDSLVNSMDIRKRRSASSWL